ncbi:MAG: methylenetetrahydrofolate reductase [Gammaproteobacteria bacterium]
MAGFEPIPHIAARRIKDSKELTTVLAALDELEVHGLLLIAGSRDKPIGEYEQSTDLFEPENFSRFRFKRLYFAGHPEGHPDIKRDLLEDALVKKIHLAELRGYQTAIVTQFCFNDLAIVQWIQRIRTAGIDSPVYIGLTGPASFRTLLRYAAICGVSTSVSHFIRQPLAMGHLFFKAKPEYFFIRLMQNPDIGKQINGFHLFPFGGIGRTVRWAEQLTRL